MQASIENLTFGVEFEVIVPHRFNRQTAALEVGRRIGSVVDHHFMPSGTNWKIVADGSVRGNGTGLEFVSPHRPPLSGEAGLEQVTKVANALKDMGCGVNQTCGFHVHVGVAGADLGFFKNLVKLYARFEEALDSIMPQSRRGNNAYFCKSVKLVREAAIDNAQSLQELSQAVARASGHGANGARYHKVNLEAYRKHNTVEFRQHSGTVEADKATNWIRTCLQLVAAAKAGKTGEGMAEQIAWNLSRLSGKQLGVAELVSRPQGATNAEIKAAFRANGQIVKGARSHLKKTGFAFIVRKDPVTGKPRFFADTRGGTVVAPIPTTLDGLADLIDATPEQRAFFARRRQQTSGTR